MDPSSGIGFRVEPKGGQESARGVAARRRDYAGWLVRMLAATSVGGGALLGPSPAGAYGPTPDGVTLGDDIVYFSLLDDQHGEELWRSDGTAAGTAIVKDLWPGPASSSPVELTFAGQTLYFVANDPDRAWELWRSDGTAESTTRVVDTPAGLRGHPADLTAVGNRLFFTVWDGAEGRSLWRTDGTAEGTIVVTDIAAVDTTAIGGTLYFTASDRRHGGELWASDGTAQGTALVRDIRPGPGGSGPEGSTPVEMTILGDKLYFTADDGRHGLELWRSDGTFEGTTLVMDIAPGPMGSVPRDLTPLGDALLFWAGDGEHGVELWRSDGTSEGTILVKDVRSGSGGMDPALGMEATGDAVYFVVRDRQHGAELWRSDGSTEGTSLLNDIQPGREGSYPRDLTPLGDSLYFRADHGEQRTGVWRTDGTVEGTVLVKDWPEDDEIGLLRAATSTDILYITVDGRQAPELWASDGTSAGTALLRDLSAGRSAVQEPPDGGDPSGPSPDESDPVSALASFVMEPLETGRRIGSWREVARAQAALPIDMSVRLDRLIARGDRLVSVGSACLGDDDCFDLAWHSNDALTWTPAGLPGEVSTVVGVVPAAGGFVAGGYVGRRRWEAAIWFSKDGRAWERRPAPPVSEVYDIAGSHKAVVVLGSDDRLWVSTHLEDWRRVRRPHEVFLAHGPGGFLAYRGGGQDSWAPTEVWRSQDGRAWNRIDLGRAGREGNDGVSIFPLEDRWVLMSEQPRPRGTRGSGGRGFVMRPAAAVTAMPAQSTTRSRPPRAASSTAAGARRKSRQVRERRSPRQADSNSCRIADRGS